jgi:hypothetical protein
MDTTPSCLYVFYSSSFGLAQMGRKVSGGSTSIFAIRPALSRLGMRAWYWDGLPQRAFGGSGG